MMFGIRWVPGGEGNSETVGNVESLNSSSYFFSEPSMLHIPTEH
jgi:hypothetical protein